MRPVRSLTIFVVVVSVGGGLLAPWSYWLAQSLSHIFPTLAQNPFHRFVNRSLLGMALLALWPFLRSLGVKSVSDVGIVRPTGQWHRLASGFALGFGSLACVALIVLALGASKLNPHLTNLPWGKELLSITATAVIVAVLEEVLFRGALFGALRKAWHWLFALLLSSVVYALVHFLANGKLNGAVDWLSGLELLPQMLCGFADWGEVIPGFFNLTLAGVLLGLAYQRTGNLYFSIGLHAGWIFWLKAYGKLTTTTVSTGAWFWRTGRLIDGWLALFVFGLLLAMLHRLFREKKDRSPYDGICF